MSIYKSAVNKPISTLVIFVGVIVMGIYSLTYIPIDLYPEINPPYVSIMTTYPGANASEIETNITKILEDQLNTVENLKEITSVSYDNLSLISLEFNWETNLDEATNDIRNVMERVYDYLPEDADRPLIFRFNTSMMPILFYAVTAEESYMGLTKVLEEKLINPLNRINGIGSVGMLGQPTRVVYVELDPMRVEAHNLTLEQVANVIAAENFNLPSGNIKMGDINYPVRIQGEFDESFEIENLIVGNFQGNPVYLKDIATVEDRKKDVSLEERIKGGQGLRMFVQKQSGANTIQITSDVKEMMKDLLPQLPPDVKITEIMDTSDFIKNSINNLSETLFYAFIFVVFVVFLFLGKWRATFIIVLTIPISLIVAFIYLYITGNTINIISLSSLAIAIGMVVDDAIVVLENISRHVERGSNPREAAIYATNEVWLSVIITTLVVVAVFFPLTLVSGMTGVMFKQLGWIVTITVVTSTIAAVSLTPMLSSKLLKLKKKIDKLPRFGWENTFGKMLNSLDVFYVRTLRFSLRHKLLIGIVAITIFVFSLFLMKFVGTDFMPQADQSSISGTIELQTGTRVEESIRIAEKIEQVFEEFVPEKVVYYTSAGADDQGSFFSLFSQTGTNVINFGLRLKPANERTRSSFDIAEDLRQRLSKFPEIVRYKVQTGGGGFSGENNVAVEIFGYDFNTTTELAHKIKDKVEAIPGAREVAISRQDEKPEIMIKLDKEKLALHGLNSVYVSTAIRNRIAGKNASLFRESGEEYDIVVRYQEKYRSSLQDIENLTIMSPTGSKIKLNEIASIDEYWSPPNIEHKRRERVVRVTAKPHEISLGELASAIKVELAKIDKPQGVMINVGGAYEEQMKSFKDLGLLMALSLILVFLVMASQFESFRMPFIIMFSIPFSFSGVILALYLTGTTLSVIAALGAVLLIGIVVKNGIVLVDYINLMRDRGIALNEAITISGKSRLRPVLMTALTTILGMLPMAVMSGEGSELWQPMGISVIGGLIFSTVITMILIPVMYAVVSKRGERDNKIISRKKMQFLIDNKEI
ncbi:MAG: efflux RND transporter permease subunit [Bacteroidales bacterium]|nr:efflux RND transporter permease subunit [Bacteroidales bacterium]